MASARESSERTLPGRKSDARPTQCAHKLHTRGGGLGVCDLAICFVKVVVVSFRNPGAEEEPVACQSYIEQIGLADLLASAHSAASALLDFADLLCGERRIIPIYIDSEFE